jgi:hypothetical protein
MACLRKRAIFEGDEGSKERKRSFRFEGGWGEQHRIEFQGRPSPPKPFATL